MNNSAKFFSPHARFLPMSEPGMPPCRAVRRISVRPDIRRNRMKKRVAIVARDRQDEALRMAVGLTLMDDSIDVFVLDRKLANSENNRLNIETMELMEMKVFTNSAENEAMAYHSTEDIARMLLGYDIVIPY